MYWRRVPSVSWMRVRFPVGSRVLCCPRGLRRVEAAGAHFVPRPQGPQMRARSASLRCARMGYPVPGCPALALFTSVPCCNACELIVTAFHFDASIVSEFVAHSLFTARRVE